jgi:hypothetical protein
MIRDEPGQFDWPRSSFWPPVVSAPLDLFVHLRLPPMIGLHLITLNLWIFY